MRKHNQKDINSLVNKILSETLEEKANSLVSRLNNKEVNELGGMGGPKSTNPKNGERKLGLDMSKEEIDDIINDMRNGRYDDDSDLEYNDDEFENELEEGFDDPYIQRARGGKDFTSKEFKPVQKGTQINMDNLRDDSITPGKYVHNKFKDIDDIFRKQYGDYDDDDFDEDEDEFDVDDINLDDLYEDDSQVCECGSKMYEGVCNECGNSYGMMDEEEEFDVDNSYDDNKTCEFHREHFGEDDERTQRFCKSMNESLKGGQKKLDKNKNNKIDSEDFKLLRRDKTETKESLKGGQKKLDANKNNKIDAEDFKLLKKKSNKKESVKLSESELIDLIESIVKEDMKGTKVNGLSAYEKAHKGSGKENKEYLDSVTKKMKGYLKDGSKGEYTENPKHFPKGNGELEKMDKKAFSMTNDLEDFNYEIAGLNIPTPDAIEFNEDFMDDLYTGSPKTGNGPGGNAIESDANERFNKIRKKNTLKKLKDQSYKRVSQPVYNEKSGNEKGKGLNIKLESTDKQTKVLNEEFTKIQHLMGYSRKTQ